MEKRDLNTLLVCKLLAQSTDPRNEPQCLQRRGMQSMRKGMEISADFAGRIPGVTVRTCLIASLGELPIRFFRILQSQCE